MSGYPKRETRGQMTPLPEKYISPSGAVIEPYRHVTSREQVKDKRDNRMPDSDEMVREVQRQLAEIRNEN